MTRPLLTLALLGLAPLAQAQGQPPPADEKGWVLVGSKPQLYELVRAPVPLPQCGKLALRSKAASSDEAAGEFGTLMQTFRAERYRGKRIRWSAFVQPDSLLGHAGLWARVDGGDGRARAFDNMQRRPIAPDAPCTRYEVVLDVPRDASVIALGLVLAGEGTARFSGPRLEVVEKSVPTTDLLLAPTGQPVEVPRYEELAARASNFGL